MSESAPPHKRILLEHSNRGAQVAVLRSRTTVLRPVEVHVVDEVQKVMAQELVTLSARRLAVAALNIHERERGFTLTAAMVDEPLATAVALVQMGCAVTSDGRGGLVVRCPRKRSIPTRGMANARLGAK